MIISSGWRPMVAALVCASVWKYKGGNLELSVVIVAEWSKPAYVRQSLAVSLLHPCAKPKHKHLKDLCL